MSPVIVSLPKDGPERCGLNPSVALSLAAPAPTRTLDSTPQRKEANLGTPLPRHRIIWEGEGGTEEVVTTCWAATDRTRPPLWLPRLVSWDHWALGSGLSCPPHSSTSAPLQSLSCPDPPAYSPKSS